MTITLNIEPKTRHRRKLVGEIIQPTQRSSIVEGATLALVLILCSLAQAATYYASPTGSGDGSDADHPMAFSSVGAGTSVGDTVHIIGMTEAIGHPDVDWPVGRLYYASYVCTFPYPAWTFNAEYRIGRFADNSTWVVGPVTITGIAPLSTDDGGRIKNGARINPSPNDSGQGYDNGLSGVGYNAAYNVALDVDSENPLEVATGSSLVSVVSASAAASTPQFTLAAVLTVLASAPAEGSFRPTIIGSDKTIKHNKSILDYSKLSKLETVSGQPTMASVKAHFAGLWMDYGAGYGPRNMRTSANSSDPYGQFVCLQLAVAALRLHCNETDAEKEQLLCRYITAGIDYAATVAASRYCYAADGGHMPGRKVPLVLAAIMLEDEGMEALIAKTGDYIDDGVYSAGNDPPDYIAFQDDDQTFYVTQAEVTLTTKDLWDGETWAYFCDMDQPPESGGDRTVGVLTAGNTVVQETTGATGTIVHVYDKTPYYRDVVTITHTSGPDFDYSGSYRITDQTDGGYFYPQDRNRWRYNGTWEPDNRGGTPVPYSAEDIGLEEWAIRHALYPQYDNRLFGATYRSNAQPNMHGCALSALLTKGAKALWQHDAFFDANARFMQETLPGGEGYPGMPRSNSAWTALMWDTYYTTYSDGIPADSDPPASNRRIRIRKAN